MNSNQNSFPSEAERSPHTWWWFGILPAFLFAGFELAALLVSNRSYLWAVLPVFMAAPVAYWLVRKGLQIRGTIIFVIAIGLQSILVSLVQREVGIPNAVTSLALITAIGLGTLPRRYMRHALIGALFIAIATILLDIFGNLARPVAEGGDDLRAGLARGGFADRRQGRWIYYTVRQEGLDQVDELRPGPGGQVVAHALDHHQLGMGDHLGRPLAAYPMMAARQCPEIRRHYVVTQSIPVKSIAAQNAAVMPGARGHVDALLSAARPGR